MRFTRSSAAALQPPLSATSSITTVFKSTKRAASSKAADEARAVKIRVVEVKPDTEAPASALVKLIPSATPTLVKKEAASKEGYIPADQILVQDHSLTNPVSSSIPPPTLIIPKAYEKDFKLDDALAHLISVDPRFKQLSDLYPCEFLSDQNLENPVDPFESLGSSIISQQISGSAARSIKARFLSLFNTTSSSATRFPTPAEVLKTDTAALRSIGFSGRKAEYMLDLASKFASGEINPHELVSMSNEEVIELLVKVRGLGVWSCEMFLIFGLKRPDVFSLGDLGVQRGMASWWGKNLALAKGKKGKFKYMSEQEMIEKSDLFRPYRTLFTWYMWKAGDVIVPIDGAGDIKKIKEE
ncbi:HhH-GPD family base excision DNA repair protein [Myxozyma melibiosi]|uniref:HhH-GPD family base excision DNA repair protein n=1 Tax=Myxozyma melibiosi TaxID=54550 RepID=A0ABR1F1P7_9ASCO